MREGGGGGWEKLYMIGMVDIFKIYNNHNNNNGSICLNASSTIWVACSRWWLLFAPCCFYSFLLFFVMWVCVQSVLSVYISFIACLIIIIIILYTLLLLGVSFSFFFILIDLLATPCGWTILKWDIQIVHHHLCRFVGKEKNVHSKSFFSSGIHSTPLCACLLSFLLSFSRSSSLLIIMKYAHAIQVFYITFGYIYVRNIYIHHHHHSLYILT